MASTYLGLNVHIIFATKLRAPLIDVSWQSELHAYLGGILRTLGVKPLAIGGVADHVHILAGVRGTHAVADVVREVKKGSSLWAVQRQERFAWQEGYSAFSVSPSDLNRVAAYVANQEEHHRKLTSADELKRIMQEFGIEYDPRFFE